MDVESASQGSTITVVSIGCQVDIEMQYETGETERLTFNVVPDQSADFVHGFLGAGTPLARAILGQPSGSVLPYRVGDVLMVRVLQIKASSVPAPNGVEARRKEVEAKAVRDAEKVNAMIFASAMNSKWGDYDPQGMDHWD